MTSLKKAKELADEFVKDLEKELGYDLVSWYIGSVAKGEYVPGKSDIDIVIIPGKNVPETIDWGKASLLMLKKRDDKKYPQVFKAGRMTSIIDPLIVFNTKWIEEQRQEYLNVTKRQ